MPHRNYKPLESAVDLGAQFIDVFEEIKGMSCEEVLKLFGFIMTATKPAVTPLAVSAPLAQSPGARKQKRNPESIATEQGLTKQEASSSSSPKQGSSIVDVGSSYPHLLDLTPAGTPKNMEYVGSVLKCLRAFNGGSIWGYVTTIKSFLSQDISFRVPFSSEGLKGRVVLILMSALMYYTYPDGVLEVESFEFLKDEDLTAHGIAPNRGCRFRFKFSGTSVSRRPVHDMVSHIGEKGIRVKLTSIVSHCKERRLAASVSAAPTAATDDEVEESGKCYAELFLRAAELATFGHKSPDFESDAQNVEVKVEENRLDLFMGFSSEGQLEYVLISEVDAEP